jgi:hypothetical protein
MSSTIIDIQRKYEPAIYDFLKEWECKTYKENKSGICKVFTTGEGSCFSTATLRLNREDNNPSENYILFTGANTRANEMMLLEKFRKINNK